MPPSMTFAIPVGVDQDDENRKDIERMPLIEAQQDHLERILIARHRTLIDQSVNEFRHGDRVRYIENAGDMLSDVREKCVMLFWRKLNLTSPFDLHLIRRSRDHIMGLPSVDCLIAHLTADNQLIFSIACSELLERVT